MVHALKSASIHLINWTLTNFNNSIKCTYSTSKKNQVKFIFISVTMLAEVIQFIHKLLCHTGLLLSPNHEGHSYYNGTFEMNENITIKTNTNTNVLKIQQPTVQTSTAMPPPNILPTPDMAANARPDMQYMEPGSSYQVIKWSPFKQETWCSVYASNGKEL